MYRGNVPKVMQEAAEIVRRLEETGVTLTALPGAIRGNAARKYRAVGSITVRRDTDRRDGVAKGFRYSRWIKVADAGRPQDRYIPYARYLWQQAHGPVPAGAFVGHADNDTMNDRLENLVLITDRRQHLLRLYRRQDVMARCRRRAGAAATRRHAQNRAAKRFGKQLQRKSRRIFECSGCGADVPVGTERCPKCGSFSIEARRIAPLSDSMAAALAD